MPSKSKTEPFKCPHWQPGQRCKPYFYEHWRARLALAVFGASVAVASPGLNCIKAIGATPPAGPIAVSVVVWGVLILGAWLGGIILAMHYEHNPLSSFVTGVGTPAFLIALITLPPLNP